MTFAWHPITTILREVAAAHDLSVASIVGPSRFLPQIQARQEAMYRARAETGASYSDIARRIGGRDHTTVLHGVRVHAARNGLAVPQGRYPASGTTGSSPRQTELLAVLQTRPEHIWTVDELLSRMPSASRGAVLSAALRLLSAGRVRQGRDGRCRLYSLEMRMADGEARP